MKTKFTLAAAIAFLVCNFSFAQSGGPDAFGYTWKNNTAPGGPVYNWKEIKGVGTQINGFGDDNQQGPFSLGWSFRYYWTNYNKIWIGSNGWIGFQNIGNIAATFPTIPNPAAPNNYLAGMMCDLTFVNGATPAQPVPGATAWYWTNNADTMIIQFDSIPYWTQANPGYSGRYTFQVILSGADSSITYQYKLTQAGAVAYDMAGEGLRTGIENSTGQIGLQVSTNVFPTASTAVKFKYPNPVTYQVFDATPAWNQNADNGGFFVTAGGSAVQLRTDLANAGNQNLTTVSSNGQVLDISQTPVWSSSVSLPSLAVAADSVMTYPSPYAANTPGTFTFRSTSVAASDINAANNITDVEMVVVDTTGTTTTLTYVTTPAPSTQNSWGGNGGYGIYIEPPYYPATITSLDFMLTSSWASGNHYIHIADDNGPGNSPGTVIYLDSLDGSVVTPGTYNNVPVNKPVIINSGGFYVGYLENGDTLSAIGTDGGLPLSNRNYEILGGQWATYRNNAVDDYMIGAKIEKSLGNISATTSADACPSNASGSATVTVTGGAPPLTYLWNDPGNQTTAVATGLAAGNYAVTVTDSLGATTTVNVTVYNNVPVSVTATNVSCFGTANGTATGTMTGGTSPYTYVWNNGATTSTITGLSSGIYSVTIIDAGGCMNSASDTVTSPTAITASASPVNASCLGNDGMANSSVSGGTPAYTYAWSSTPVQTTANASNLSAGSYTLTVTDANGCTKTANVTITSVPFVLSISTTPISCYGGSNGSATVTSTGGTPVYTYAWSTNPVQNTITATGLSAGTYSVVVTDSKGCVGTKTVTLTNPTQMIANATSPVAASCPTCNDGTATATAVGGLAPLTYVWSSGASTQTATGLLPGNYTVCVTDSKGCTACDTVNVLVNGIYEAFQGASVTINPNPFSTQASVNIALANPADRALHFVIYDIYGREVKSIDLSDRSSNRTIDFVLNRGLTITSGLYFYKLRDNNQILSAGKLIIQ